MNIQREYLYFGAPVINKVTTSVANTDTASNPPVIAADTTDGQSQVAKWTGNFPDQTVPPAGVLYANIVNQGTASLTLTINSSFDNGFNDTYSGNQVTFRAAGANVTSLVVPAGGKSQFIIEYSAASAANILARGMTSRPYFLFTVTANAMAMIGLAAWDGLLEIRPSVGVG